MTSYLVFDLYGPIASFGDTAVGEYRPTYSYPSKSSIVGLVAAALGIERDHEERLQSLSSNLGFAVLVLSRGILLRDYHTIQVPSSVRLKKRPVRTRKDELAVDDVNTILSTRDYRMDSLYRIALWSKSEDFYLDDIKEALCFPKFTLYLGRKSCPPALPLKPEIVKAEKVEDALIVNSLPLEFLGPLLKVDYDSKYPIYKDVDFNESTGNLYQVMRRDRLISRRKWQYGEREEIMQFVGGEDVFQQNTKMQQ